MGFNYASWLDTPFYKPLSNITFYILLKVVVYPGYEKKLHPEWGSSSAALGSMEYYFIGVNSDLN